MSNWFSDIFSEEEKKKKKEDSGSTQVPMQSAENGKKSVQYDPNSDPGSYSYTGAYQPGAAGRELMSRKYLAETPPPTAPHPLQALMLDPMKSGVNPLLLPVDEKAPNANNNFGFQKYGGGK